MTTDTPPMRRASDLVPPVTVPSCYQRGTLTIELRLMALRIGTWSLAGSQLKASAMEVPYLVCTVQGCGFIKAPTSE